MRRAVAAIAVAVLAGSLAAPPEPAAGGSAPPGRLSHRPPPRATCLFPGSASEAACRPGARDAPAWAPHRVLVRWGSGTPRDRPAGLLAALGATVERRIPSWDVEVIRLPPSLGVTRALARLQRSPFVRAAQPDYLLLPSQVAPDDTRFPGQWALRNRGQVHRLAPGPGPRSRARGASDADIDALAAWGVERGSARSVIAILDSGVDVEHPDLAGNLWTNPGESPGGGDDDGNGYVDDLHGWDFAENDAGLVERRSSISGAGHGTHVAGIAAASSNGSGIVGVCPGCSIMVLKFMRPVDLDRRPGPDAMAGYQSDELEALAYARREGADVLNASFGARSWSPLERRAYKKLGRSGVVSVIAAGNLNGDNDLLSVLDFNRDGVADSSSPAYPASYDLTSIISVAASNHRDQYGYNTACALVRGKRVPCAFTSWGHDSVDLAAPGVDITSTVPGGGFGVYNGTSMAAPHVSGVAGLVKSRHPRWRPPQVKNAILNSADREKPLRKLRALPGRRPNRGGFTRSGGRLNAHRALLASSRGRYPRTDGTIKRARKMRKYVRGKLSWPRDTNDVYRKKLRPGRYIAVLDGARNANLDLIGYKPGTREIWQIERGCFRGRRSCKVKFFQAHRGSRETARFRVGRRGRFFFHVTSPFSRSRYSLSIKRLIPPSA